MAEDREQRTEDPTPKRLADARKKGNIPRSTDVSSAAVLFTGAILLLWEWKSIAQILRDRMVQNLGTLPTEDLTVSALKVMGLGILRDLAFAIGPIALGVMLAGIVANYAQVGVLFSGEPLKPTFDKLNPLSGFKRIFSLRGGVETLKGILKIVIVGYFGYQVVHERYTRIVTAMRLDHYHLGKLLGDTIWTIAWRSLLALAILGLADYAYQRWEWFRNLKMTKQEVKDEAKQQEGSPEVKGEIRRRQRQAARRRMMQAVPKASVVVTNPTHYAVALRYDRETMEVPLVVAKGADLVAKRIRDIAREAQVPIVENKPVAQALFKQVEVGDEIPPDLYAVVAEILVAVTRAGRRAMRA